MNKIIFSVGVPRGVPLTIDKSARQSLKPICDPPKRICTPQRCKMMQSSKELWLSWSFCLVPGLLLVGVEEVHGFVLAAHGHRAPVAGVPSILVLVIACMGEAPRLPKSFNPEETPRIFTPNQEILNPKP